MKTDFVFSDKNIQAVIEDGNIESETPLFGDFLKAFVSNMPKRYAPDEDYAKALYIIDEFGGRITHHNKQEYDPDVIY